MYRFARVDINRLAIYQVKEVSKHTLKQTPLSAHHLSWPVQSTRPPQANPTSCHASPALIGPNALSASSKLGISSAEVHTLALLPVSIQPTPEREREEPYHLTTPPASTANAPPICARVPVASPSIGPVPQIPSSLPSRYACTRYSGPPAGSHDADSGRPHCR